MTLAGRACQWLGLAMVLVSAFLPTLELVAFPTASGAGAWPAAAFLPGARQTPADVLGCALLDTTTGTAAGCPFWTTRRWYPWYLALAWLAALWFVRRRAASPRRRRLAGIGLWLVTIVLLGFEAAYLHTEYLPLLPAPWGRVEGLLAWGIVATILLYRRRGDRRLDGVEALVASQALLGFVHGLTLPATMARGWMGHFPASSVTAAVWQNFPTPFWVGMAGMLLVAAPVYLGRRRAPAPAPAPVGALEPPRLENPSSAPPS